MRQAGIGFERTRDFSWIDLGVPSRGAGEGRVLCVVTSPQRADPSEVAEHLRLRLVVAFRDDLRSANEVAPRQRALCGYQIHVAAGPRGKTASNGIGVVVIDADESHCRLCYQALLDGGVVLYRAVAVEMI